MTSSEPTNSASTAESPTPQSTAAEADSGSQTGESKASPVTQDQADQILQELKSIKQNIFWLLLVAGFFAARSFFFHY
jgi:hypothetical protein